jgi:hypothetical protein
MTVFLCSVERRFSAPAAFVTAAAHSLGQVWPQAIGEADAQRTVCWAWGTPTVYRGRHTRSLHPGIGGVSRDNKTRSPVR